MAGTAVRGRLSWQVATVAAVSDETARVRTIVLDLPDWRGHEDGYAAERSYSIASATAEPVAITVERLEDGEVSPYLTRELRPGDQMEIRGPIGNWFTWGPEDGGPLLLIAGGSGVVPLRAILRRRERSGNTVPARMLYSSRSLEDVIYREELDKYRGSAEVRYTLTRRQPAGWGGFAGRVDDAMLARVAWPASQRPLAFICGPTPFVEAVAELLVARHYPESRVKTERFGGA
jgi:ferredoxin-NADP reductase